MRSASAALNQLAGRSWLVPLAALGVFFAADDQTSVVAILPKMIDGAGLSQDEFFRAAWIVNAYILGYVVAMPLMGRIADAYGHGRVFAAALLLFCAGSAAVALSTDLTTMSIARAVQAVGGGTLVPISMAIAVSHAAPEKRALALAAMAAAAEAGGLIGPLWGGSIAELGGWRSVFWINLPMCLPLAYLVWRQAGPPLHQRVAIDYAGAALIGLSLICLTFALTNDPIDPRPAVLTLGLFAAAAACFGLFLRRQATAAAPMVDLALFRRRSLSAAFVTNTLVGGVLIVAMVSVPLFTNVVREGSPLEGGLNLMRLTVALAAGALAGGYVTQRLGIAAATGLGLVLAGIGFLGLSRWDADPSFLVLTLPLLVAGLGFGLVISPLNTAVLDEAAPGDHATLASLLTVVRLLGALVGVALLTTQGLSGFYAEAGLVPLDDPRYGDIVQALEVDSFRDIFLVTAAVCFLSLIPAALLRRSTTAR